MNSSPFPDDSDTGREVGENLVAAMDWGMSKASFDLIEAVAEALGISEVHGVSLRTFYDTACFDRTGENIAHIADTDPVLATRVKQQWDSLTEQSALSEHSRTRARARK